MGRIGALRSVLGMAGLVLVAAGVGCGDGAGLGADLGGELGFDGADAAQTPDASTDAATDGQLDAALCQVGTDCSPPAGLGPCERVACIVGACTRVAAPDGSACDDADRCTLETRCDSGTCGGGVPLPCDDDNPCTADLCDPLTGCQFAPSPDGASCEDADPCTIDDRCTAGACAGASDPSCACEMTSDCAAFGPDDACSGSLVCDAGYCRLDPSSRVVCPPPGPCRVALCDPGTGACSEALGMDRSPCDDTNPCTGSDACAAGHCVGVAGGCACKVDADCAEFVGPGYDLCQGPLRCVQGTCAPDPSGAVLCVDSAAGDCLTEACDPTTGLCATVTRADGSDCESDEACAASGRCQRGQCEAVASDCDDGNACTADACAGDAGCVHTPQVGACEDGDPCTTIDACAAGVCVGGPALACDDLEPCTVDSCDPQAGGCVFTARPDGSACQGADLCMVGGVCEAGVCGGAKPATCAAPGPCTVASCNPLTGCVAKSAPDGAACDDGDPCTQPGLCAGGACAALPVACKDGNPCTIDSCDATSGGCVHVPAAEDAPCDPPSPCLASGTCQAGQCAGGEPVVCPALPCQLAACDEVTGACEIVSIDADGTACDAGPCTLGGVCADGVCAKGQPVDCDDGDACTLDVCDPATGGCHHPPLSCPEPTGDACLDATCGPPGGCDAVTSKLCLDGQVLLTTTFPCDGAALWTAAPAPGALSLTVGPSPPSPSPWDADCSLGIGLAAPPAGPWSASAGTEQLSGGGGASGQATVRVAFVELWDADSDAVPPARSIALLNGPAVVAQAALPPPQSGDRGVWRKREALLSLADGAQAAALVVTVAGDAKSGYGLVWRMDKLVVVALETPAP
jgi:hypothetical protein